MPFYRCNQTALVIFDVFKAYKSEVLLATPKKENIKDKGKIKKVPINPLMADVMVEHGQLNFQ